VYGSSIKNITFHETRRCDVAVGVDYGADIDATRAALEAALEEVPIRLPDGAHRVVLTGLGGSSVDWSVRVWCKTPDFLTCSEQTIRAVKRALDAAGIGIPFPQLDVHLLKENT
ncbi:MAG: mechanosensitive ion channel family protein, partial [Myxococcales bacterium]|nr:mechanosensitive ion channel family protein [Myxococcales bacterium]